MFRCRSRGQAAGRKNKKRSKSSLSLSLSAEFLTQVELRCTQLGLNFEAQAPLHFLLNDNRASTPQINPGGGGGGLLSSPFS